METKQIIILALMLSCGLTSAQTGNKQATVRIKKTTIVNGVEKTTDTTFTSNDPGALNLDEGNAKIEEIKDENGNVKKIVIINDDMSKPEININEDKDGKNSTITINSSKDKNNNAVEKTITIDQSIGKDGGTKIMVINTGDKMTPEEEAIMMKAGKGMSQAFVFDTNNSGTYEPKEGQQLMIKKVRCGARQGEIDSVTEVTTIIIGKKLNITDANNDELKQLNKSTGISDNKLAIDKMNFYPNPNNGKFQMSFTLPKKANTDITILNIEGKSIYNEKLANFSGNYDKEIDISQSPKGTYFIKISQGNNSLVKKIVIE